MVDFHHPILHEVAELGLPRNDDAVINHGAALVVRGVRDERPDGDIDMLMSLENIHYLRKVLGWVTTRKVVGINSRTGKPVEVVVTHDEDERFDVHRWDFSLQQYYETGHGRQYLEEQKMHAEQDEKTGLWVASLEHVRQTKVGTGRIGDETDIMLIDAFSVKP